MTRRYDALQEFFLGYFHPDWRLDDDSRSAVVDRFKRTAAEDAASHVAADLADLLAEPLREEDLHETVLSEYSLFYDPWRDEVTIREWLEGLLKEMEGSGGK
jgi:hypothetical protein